MRKQKATEYRGIAQEIARDSIVTHALSRLIEQIVAEVHAVKQKEIDALRDVLVKAREVIEDLRSYGCPECEADCSAANPPVTCCPIRRSNESLAAIDAALKETGADSE